MANVTRRPIPLFIGALAVGLFAAILTAAFYPESTNDAWISFMESVGRGAGDLINSILFDIVMVGGAVLLVLWITWVVVRAVRRVVT